MKLSLNTTSDYSSNRFVLILEPIEEVSPVCSYCDQTLSTSIHSQDAVVVEDLPISGKRVFLCVSKRKALCPTSNRIRVEKLTWIKKRFTQRFTEHVYRLTSITTNTQAGWFLGLEDETVYRIDRATLEEMAAQKLYPVTVPSHMSVDEVAWQKWHHYVTNVVAIEIRKVIWSHDGRGKTVLDSFYHALGPEGCKAIEAVVSDGARGFISSTKEHARNALLILDHFHVKKYLNDAIDQVRKKELTKAREAHVDQLGMDCRYCHSAVEKSWFSNIPASSTCMNCHNQVLKDDARLALVRESAASDRPILWVQIHKTPDYVYFNHAVHVNRGISCVECHGPIDKMEEVYHAKPFSMSFCLDCHRDPAAKIRPLDKITDLNWKPSDDPKVAAEKQKARGKEMVEQWRVESLQNCSACHQ